MLTKNLITLTFITLTFILSLMFDAKGQSLQLQNSYNRVSTSLNGEWQMIVDPYENGFYNYRYEPFEYNPNPSRSAFFMNAKAENEADLIEYNFDESQTLNVPGDWNTQNDKLYYYEGTVWYKKSFDYRKKADSNRVFVNFEAVNYQADVYFNGTKLGQHIGGFTPFYYEITDLLKDTDNFLVVKVDNKRKKEAVPTLNTDWWNYGGITRDVRLIETPSTYVTDYSIQLDQNNNNIIKGSITLDGNISNSSKVRIEIPELGINKTLKANASGEVDLELKSNKIEYWSLENPKLYTVKLSVNEDNVTDLIGFRTITTDGPNILLNGRSIFLKGISIHEESPINDGRGHSIEDARQLLSWAQEMGCNYVRLAHYPHNEHMVRLADQMGILVWEENPVYWTIEWENPATFDNAKNQLTELIQRDKNRASVIIWSMANETPRSEARHKFLSDLAAHTRDLDPTRLISAALENKDYNGNPNIKTIEDDFADVVDILSFNQYFGWYYGDIEKSNEIEWKITQNKPVIISEFGAGAKFGLHGSKTARWTEEYQEHLYDNTLKMIDRIDQLRGVSPWILVDFRSPRRVLPGIQDDWNRKGLISEKGEKKMAYYTLKKYYEGKVEW